MQGYASGHPNAESNSGKKRTSTWEMKERFTWAGRRLAFRCSYGPLTTVKCRQLGKCLLVYFHETEILHLTQLVQLCLLFLFHFTMSIFTSFIVVTAGIDNFFSIPGKVTESIVLKWPKLFTPVSAICQIITNEKIWKQYKKTWNVSFQKHQLPILTFFNESFCLFLSNIIFHWRMVCIF